MLVIAIKSSSSPNTIYAAFIIPTFLNSFITAVSNILSSVKNMN